jgi:hypothetical protein
MATLKLNFFLQAFIFVLDEKSSRDLDGGVERVREFMNYLQMQPSSFFFAAVRDSFY